MRVVIIYESLFGDTREIAEAIAEGIEEGDAFGEVRCLPAGSAGTAAEGADLTVVGGPTHVLGMSSERSRTAGAANERKAGRGEMVEIDPAAPGVREWLEALPAPAPGSRAAAFDTRSESRFSGGAAKRIAHVLEKRGYTMATSPEGFTVEATDGPLRAGEVTRARAWGAALARHELDVRASR